MRTVFLHGEVEQYERARSALAERFAEWSDGRPACGLVEFLLDDKLSADGLLARWTEDDLRRFLVRSAPRRLLLAEGWAAVPEFLAAWISFLDDTGLLTSDRPVRALLAAVERASPAYLAAMADPAEWGADKFWSVVLHEHGVDADDEDAVETFFETLESGEVDVDESLAETVEERDTAEAAGEPAFWLPPRHVEEVPLDVPARLRELHTRLASEQRRFDLDEVAGLLEVDRFEAGLLVEWARQAGLVRVVGERLTPTHISAAVLAEPELLWTRLWQTFVLLDEYFGGEPGLLPEGGELFGELVQAALCGLYSSTGAVALEHLVGAISDDVLDPVEESRDRSEALRRTLVRMFDQWAALGVVRTGVTTDAEQIAAIESAVPAGVTAERTVVQLTKPGLFAARGSLQAFGFVAPTVEDMAQYPVEVLVLALPESPPEVAEVLVSDWLGRLGARGGAQELAALLRRADDPAVRLAALWLLEQTGEEGVAVARDLADDPVAGPAVRMWLQARPSSDEVVARPGDELLLELDGMAVAVAGDAGRFLAEFQQRPTADQIALIDRIPETAHVGVPALLSVIAEEHPDESVAGAARRGLEKVG
ncbi:hypothetical protein [Saccharopolyspora taberi]|uniref:Uncharacterized protein n=1 Tax=Saccharopolyspora taberi TaxID=60895 RepID=A0ABN3VKK3_9PSEU